MAEAAIVHIIEDDASLRDALDSLFRSVGMQTRSYGTVQDFLDGKQHAGAPGCLVLDVRLPGMSGLDFQAQLAEHQVLLPVVMMTGHGDIPMTVQAVKAGAVDFLTKPVAATSLLAAVRAGVERDALSRQAMAETESLRSRFASLTGREREVLAALANGRLNKQIAADLGIVEQTVKFHRTRIMERMQARTVAELMHMAARLQMLQPQMPATPPRPD
jgi:FixJ family two-component response regulator